MGYAKDTGYVPSTIEDIISYIRVGINEQFGTSYTAENFIGTNFYKTFYYLAQRVQENEIKLSEIFLKLQNYFKITNETIINPKVTPEGLLDIFASKGYVASIKAPSAADAGKLYVCVDVDDEAPDYDEKKLEICNILKDNTSAGVVTQGTESETLVLSNGQAFDFKFNLPNRKTTYLKLTITISRNNQLVIESPDDVKTKLLNNINARYKLGMDFEPEKYFNITDDAPYASDVTLQYSFNDADYFSVVYEATYDELLDVGLDRLTIIQV